MKHYLYWLIIVLMFSNILLLYKYRQSKKEYNTLYTYSYNEINAKNKITYSIKFNNIQLNSASIVTDIEEFEQINNTSIVLLYPNNICDVCQKDIFKYFQNSLSKKYVNDISVFVPISDYNNFINYNKQYDLNFTRIYGYDPDRKIFENIDNLKSRCFFSINKEMVLNDIYIIDKPIDTNSINQYFHILNKKYTINY